MDSLKKAYDIAARCLRKNYEKEGILAGSRHFDDYWARDSFFASWGALELNDHKIVKKNLDLFLRHQKKDGELPIRIGKKTYQYILPLIGVKRNFRKIPIYHQDKGFNKSSDQNSLFIIAASNYIKKTKDIAFLKKHIKKFEKACLWNYTLDVDNDSLIEEGPYASWADCIKKTGKVLYTNICHCHAANCLSEMYSLLKKSEEKNKWKKEYEKIKALIDLLFWKKDYYIDWIDEKKNEYFSTDGNVLAILWNIADNKKTNAICKNLNKVIGGIPAITNYPKYPIRKVCLQERMGGIKDYHNGMSWLWLGALSALALFKAKKRDKAKQVMKKISDLIIAYDSVYEVYGEDGKPIDRFFYKSDYDFAWSSGLFIYAYENMEL